MAPTQSTVTAAPTSFPSPAPSGHVSVPAMVVLTLFLVMMAALALAVILRQRKAMAAFKRKANSPVKLPSTSKPSWSCLRFRSKPTSTHAAATTDMFSYDPPAVGAPHAASVLLAAAPSHVFSPPMAMHFRVPLQDKTVLILGAPWYPVSYGAQCCGAPAGDHVNDRSRRDIPPPVRRPPTPMHPQPAVRTSSNDLDSISSLQNPMGDDDRRLKDHTMSQHYIP
ncbi:hypothetical protein JVU11DRAFT_1191 [Chiua virens]|nr:hypothetical protein JVU11DRAFT_1191 [Chiua virens]